MLFQITESPSSMQRIGGACELSNHRTNVHSKMLCEKMESSKHAEKSVKRPLGTQSRNNCSVKCAVENRAVIKYANDRWDTLVLHHHGTISAQDVKMEHVKRIHYQWNISICLITGQLQQSMWSCKWCRQECREIGEALACHMIDTYNAACVL